MRGPGAGQGRHASRAAPGAAITYTLRFTNTGPGSARGVVLRDSVPVSVTISRVTSSTVGSGVRITQTSAGPNFAWAVSDLAVGAGGVITLAGTLSPSAALIGTRITNTATITASNDITIGNNRADAALSVLTAGAGTANLYLPAILKQGPPAAAGLGVETTGSDGAGSPDVPDTNQPPALEPGAEPVGRNQVFLPLMNR